MENLRKTVSPNYLTYNCANNTYTDFTYRFAEAINSIDSAERIRDLVWDPKTW